MFVGQYCIASEKRDGEHTSLYSDYSHARSLDSKNHESRNWVKGLWGKIKHNIPENWRICGENMYAKHSVGYNNLDTYFEVFSIYDENNMNLSWDSLKEWCQLLELKPVPVLWEGIFDLKTIENLHKTLDLEKQEGFVLRIADSFHYNDYETCVAKWVRANHVQTDEHWMNAKVIPNKLKKE